MHVRRVLSQVGIAVTAAVALNLLLYLLGKWTGADFIVPQGPDQALAPLGVLPVVLVTAFTMLVGAAAYLLLNRFLPAKAWTLWRVGAGLFVAASFLPLMGDFSLATKGWLATMHVTTPALLVGALARARLPPPRPRREG